MKAGLCGVNTHKKVSTAWNFGTAGDFRSGAASYYRFPTDSSNTYQAWIDVTPGPNTITVEAEDWSPNANTATKSWTVNVTGGTPRSFTYDGNGNTLSDGIRTYLWDAEDRLVKITQGTDEYEFIYDGLSRRVAEKVNGTLTRRWIWDGTEIAEQRAADGTTVERRFFTQGEERVGGTDAGANYYTRDHLGSIRELTDDTTAVRARYDYDPYGSREKLSGDLDCEFAFTGHFHHAPTGLHLALYRAYDSETGRWLSRDRFGSITSRLNASLFGSPSSAHYELGILEPEFLSEGPNLYAYVGNSPLNYADSSGEIAIPVVIGIGIAALSVWSYWSVVDCANEMHDAISDYGDSCGNALSDPTNASQHIKDAQNAMGDIQDSAKELGAQAASSSVSTTLGGRP